MLLAQEPLTEGHPQESVYEGHPASTPPLDGASPFLAVPVEVRLLVFDYILPDPREIVLPKISKRLIRPQRRAGSDTVNLLMVSKEIHHEVGDQIYQRTKFGVKISPEGMQILHHSNMPLEVDGHRVGIKTNGDTFARPNTPTGFNNMRHLILHLEPSATVENRKMECQAIRKSLQCLVEIRGSAPLNELEIHFCGSKDGSFDYWWNSEANALRTSPIHAMSMIERVTQPLEDLRQIQRTPYIDIPSMPSAYGKDLTYYWQERFASLLCSSTPPETPSAVVKSREGHFDESYIRFHCQKRFGVEAKVVEDVSAEILAERIATDGVEADWVEEEVEEIFRGGKGWLGLK
ncbi:MAG: hypothetical protein Q9165_003635 [Trypethelium subeluteriae]